jgi:hypothetical protein
MKALNDEKSWNSVAYISWRKAGLKSLPFLLHYILVNWKPTEKQARSPGSSTGGTIRIKNIGNTSRLVVFASFVKQR